MGPQRTLLMQFAQHNSLFFFFAFCLLPLCETEYSHPPAGESCYEITQRCMHGEDDNSEVIHKTTRNYSEVWGIKSVLFMPPCLSHSMLIVTKMHIL